MKIIKRFIQFISLAFFVFLIGRAVYPLELSIPPELYSLLSPVSFVATSLAMRTMVWILAFSLIILASGFLLGRAFCGWVCPLGAFIDFTDWCIRPIRRAISKPIIRWGRSVKFIVLGLIGGGSIIGLNLAGIFDPLSFLPRSFILGFSPHLDRLVKWLLCLWVKIPYIADKTYDIREFIRWDMLYFETPKFETTIFLVIIGIILLMGIFIRRGFCRYLCPLGAILGLAGKWAPVRRYADVESCRMCGVCVESCRMSAIDDDGLSHNTTECILCLDCKYDCDFSAVYFLPRRDRKPSEAEYGIDRRRFLFAFGGGLLAGAGLALGNEYIPAGGHVIRPPGVVHGSGFGVECVKCGMCMKVCPTGGLQPVASLNLEKLWTPELVPRIGYCEFNCNLCGEICPSSAIPKLPLEEKQRFKIGLAVIDRDICLPWAEDEQCSVCEEHCPTSPKAIVLEEGEVEDILLPYVKRGRCIGCGECEYVCPVEGKSAIVVVVENVGEYASVGGGSGGSGKGRRNRYGSGG